MMPGLQAYRWYSVLEGTTGAAQLPPPLAGYMWIDVGGPQFRSVPRDWFEIEEGPPVDSGALSRTGTEDHA